MKNNNHELIVDGAVNDTGLVIRFDGEEYQVKYDDGVWQSTPDAVKQALLENLVFGNTHFIPLIVGGDTIRYTTAHPLFESAFFRNQLYDMLYCEIVDKTEYLEYLRRFHNLKYRFASRESTIPLGERMKRPTRDTAVLPFSFGKESLVTLAMCRELGMDVVPVYTQEPIQPYEQEYKTTLMKRFANEFGIRSGFIENGPGMFRNGVAFGGKMTTSIGWAAQTTLLTLMMIPYVWHYRATHIVFGSEYSNNDVEDYKGWDMYASFDQTSFWTPQQSVMARILSSNVCGVYSALEPLQELAIFYILHTKFPDLGAYQFSCSATHPLVKGSQWCHRCSKCYRNYIFALAMGIEPKSIGFREDMTLKKSLDHNMDSDEVFDYDIELCTYILQKTHPEIYKRLPEKGAQNVSKKTLFEHFFAMRPHTNLPPAYADKMTNLYAQYLNDFEERVRKYI